MFFHKAEIGWVRNSGFQALNLALQFGAKRIALCGYDFTMHRGTHWHGRHPAGLNNPTERALEGWRVALEAQRPILQERGVEVFVATPDSRLAGYPRRPLMELLDDLHHAGAGPAPHRQQAHAIA
jgi:hypothetical protein